MKKIYILIFIFLLSMVTSCKRNTDIDGILDKNVIENQFIFRDCGSNAVELNKNYMCSFNSLQGLLFCDERGIFALGNMRKTILQYNFETNKNVEFSECPYTIDCSTYDNNLIAHDNMKNYYLINFETFEIIEQIEKKSEEDYMYGVSNYKRMGDELSYTYKEHNITITLEDILLKNNLNIRADKNEFDLDGLYRYEEDFYISIRYWYSFLSRELLVFKIEDNGYRFVDYCHYSVDTVEFVKYCGPIITEYHTEISTFF